jgi:hypothetical protein
MNGISVHKSKLPVNIHAITIDFEYPLMLFQRLSPERVLEDVVAIVRINNIVVYHDFCKKDGKDVAAYLTLLNGLSRLYEDDDLHDMVIPTGNKKGKKKRKHDNQ